MTGALADLLPFGREFLWTGIAVFLRVGAVMALLPAFGEQAVPLRIRLALTFMFTLVVAPAMVGSIPIPSDTYSETLSLVASETVNGLFLGILVRLFVIVLQISGTMAAQATSLSQILGGGAAPEPLPAIGHLYLIAGLALAVLLGLHVRVAEMLIGTYAFLPAGSFPTSSDVAEFGISRVAAAFGFAFSLAAPFLIASLVYNLILGVINRAMPQLMVAFVGAPAITAGSLFLLFLSAPTMLAIWVEALNGFLADPFGSAP